MRGVMGAADRAVSLARAHLSRVDPLSEIHDVQSDPRFQHRGVDLLWDRPGKEPLGVEVKGDRHARRGNYFLELVSTVEKDTPGCFLYSEADLLLYVFLETREVHSMVAPAARHARTDRVNQDLSKFRRSGRALDRLQGEKIGVRHDIQFFAAVRAHGQIPIRLHFASLLWRCNNVCCAAKFRFAPLAMRAALYGRAPRFDLART
jgi:hypothetical protein